MTTRTIAGFIAVTIASLVMLEAPAAFAQAKTADAKPMAPPPPPAELDSLKVFLGEWKCEGMSPAIPEMPPPHKVMSTNSIKMALGGYWHHVVHKELKTKIHPMEFTAEGAWGYDSSSKMFTGQFVGTYGTYETRTSKGWEGDKLVWDGFLMNHMGVPKTPFKHTFIKKSDKEIAETFAIEQGGKWVTLGDNVCKK